MREISKSYGVVKALRPLSLELARGDVHALVGENGSGKSTFVGIVSGTVTPDTGTVELGGKACRRHAPWESQRHGALTVFQDGSVVPELSVAQNLYLGTPAGRRPPYRRLEEWATERLRMHGLERLPAEARAERLSPADRQLLEIVRALMARPSVLLLDEATSALDAGGVEIALDLMRQAADDGCAVLFVTHRLSEVFRVADRVSVLRDGAWQGTYDASAVDQQRLVELMAGRSVDMEFPARALPEEIGGVVLRARDLAGPGYGPVEVEVRAGELIGIAGADDNGQIELLRGLAGIGVPDGRLEIGGRPIATYGDGVSAGVLLLSSDRRNESLFTPLAIRENLAVGMLGKLSRLGIVSWSREKALIRDSVGRFGIRLHSPEDAITSLSGGNQQKVALGRVLATEPDVVLVLEPTLGVDVRSRVEIYRMLRENAKRGLAVVIVSSDASELAGLCDRILVVSRGSVVAELPGETATEEEIVHAFAAAGHERRARAADDQVGRERPLRRIREFARSHENPARLLLLALLLVVLGAYAQSKNSTFLSVPSLYNVFLLAAPLSAVAAAEFVVLFAGGIDVSVGAAMGVTVALLSFVATGGSFVHSLLVSVLVAVGFGAIVGAANASLIERIRMSPVIATIATLGILQGVGLQLRPTAAGTISAQLADGVTRKIWIFPWSLLVLAGLFVAADWILRSSGHGLRVRVVGLNPHFAFRLGVDAPRLRRLSYVGCGILAALAGVLLAGQVGVGDSTVGNQYTLLAIAAPVLGGASLLGGFGSFVGCLLGAIVLSVAQTLPTTLGLNDAASFLLTGALTLIALLVYSSGAAQAVRAYFRTLWHKAAVVRAAVTPGRDRADEAR